MKKKKALFFIFVCCLFFAFAATQAKTNKEDGSDSLRRAVYFELGGKFFPSLNIDFRRNKQFAWGMGLGIWRDEEENPQTLFIPSLSAYRFFGRRARLEVGGGIGAFVGTYSGLASAMIFSNLGYRYQKKQGLFFRAALTPFLGFPIAGKSRMMLVPWAGIGLGYTF
jgi:hypothetical protein